MKLIGKLFIPFEALLLTLLTANRRKSFFCDGSRICFWCNLFRKHLKLGFPKKEAYIVHMIARDETLVHYHGISKPQLFFAVRYYRQIYGR